jgi:hypothetical protein
MVIESQASVLSREGKGEIRLHKPVSPPAGVQKSGIASNQCIVKRRLIEALTPLPLSEIEIGGIFERSSHASTHYEDADYSDSDDADFLDQEMLSKCQVDKHDLEKSFRYHAVWRIIFSSDSHPELFISSDRKHTEILDIQQ